MDSNLKEREKAEKKAEKRMKKEAKKVERDLEKVEKDQRALEKDMDKLDEDQRKYEEARDIEFRRVHGSVVISDEDRRTWDDKYLHLHPLSSLSTRAPLVTDATSDSSATHDKMVGKMHENNGKIQEKIGCALNKPELEAKGQAKQVQGMAEQAIGESKSLADQRAKDDEKERKIFLDARECEYQRIYGSFALSELDRGHWNTGYLMWYRRTHPEFYFSGRLLVSEIERRQWLDNFELDCQRYEAEEQRRRLVYQQLRDADFLRTYGNRTLTTDERSCLENDHLVVYRVAQKNPGFMVPFVVINSPVASDTYNRASEPEYRVNPATGIAIETEPHMLTKDGKHPVVGTMAADRMYVNNAHPATVTSTGSHDVQVGKMHERNGKIQEKIGAVFHDPVLEAHGQAKQTIGQNEQLIGEQKKTAEDRVHELKKSNAL